VSRRRVEHFRLAEETDEFYTHIYQGAAGRFISIGAADGEFISSLTVGTLMVVKHKAGEEVPLDGLRGVVFNIEYGRGEPILVTALKPVHIMLVLEARSLLRWEEW